MCIIAKGMSTSTITGNQQCQQSWIIIQQLVVYWTGILYSTRFTVCMCVYMWTLQRRWRHQQRHACASKESKYSIPAGGRGDVSGAQRCVLNWLKYLQIDLHISAVVVAASRSSLDFVFTWTSIFCFVNRFS